MSPVNDDRVARAAAGRGRSSEIVDVSPVDASRARGSADDARADRIGDRDAGRAANQAERRVRLVPPDAPTTIAAVSAACPRRASSPPKARVLGADHDGACVRRARAAGGRAALEGRS